MDNETRPEKNVTWPEELLQKNKKVKINFWSFSVASFPFTDRPTDRSLARWLASSRAYVLEFLSFLGDPRFFDALRKRQKRQRKVERGRKSNYGQQRLRLRLFFVVGKINVSDLSRSLLSESEELLPDNN